MGIGVVLVGHVQLRAELLLDGDGFTLLATVGPAAAAAAVLRERPTVVVAGLGADTSARTVVEVLDVAPEAAVLAVGAGEDPAEVLAVVGAGAAGYLVRSSGPAALVAAVRRIAAGETVFSPGLAALVLESRSRAPGTGPVATRLTDRETDVLRLVVDGLTARQIATRLAVSPRTVENHVQHVLRKLGLGNRATLVRYAIENGLV